MKFLNTILNIIFPIRCVSCGKEGFDLCIKCLSGSPSVLRENTDWIFSLFDYHHSPIKKSIWLLKYKGKKELANTFAEIMYGRIIEELSELRILKNFCEPILIPIPLSKKRYRERGYNQAELICKKLIEIDNKNILNNSICNTNISAINRNFKLEKDVLIKIKETEHQARIKDRKKRLNNLVNSFSIKNQELIKGKNIILIDDITTTGATLNEAKKTLKYFGGKKIIAFTIAH